MRRPERQRKEYRTWQQCENRCIAAGSRLSYTLQDGQKGNPGYKDGKEQFELHQTVNPADVENAVWQLLCNARLVGVESARESMLEVTGDDRVPMKEIYRLFRGDGSIDEVFEAVHVGDPSEPELMQ